MKGPVLKFSEICRRVKFSEPSRGFALVGHVFANITLFIGPHINNHCRNRCIMEQKCRSINIGQVRKDKVLCQLSDSDQLKHPNDIKLMDDFLYLGIEVRSLTQSLTNLKQMSTSEYCRIQHQIYIFKNYMKRMSKLAKRNWRGRPKQNKAERLNT